jgi:hypothetical protein
MICEICYHDIEEKLGRIRKISICKNCNSYVKVEFWGDRTDHMIGNVNISVISIPYGETSEHLLDAIKEVRSLYENQNNIKPGFREVYHLRGNQIRYVIEIKENDSYREYLITLPDCVEPIAKWNIDDFLVYGIQSKEAVAKFGWPPEDMKGFIDAWVEVCEKFGMKRKKE